MDLKNDPQYPTLEPKDLFKVETQKGFFEIFLHQLPPTIHHNCSNNETPDMSRGEGRERESWWHEEKMSERESKQASDPHIVQSSYYCVIFIHLI